MGRRSPLTVFPAPPDIPACGPRGGFPLEAIGPHLAAVTSYGGASHGSVSVRRRAVGRGRPAPRPKEAAHPRLSLGCVGGPPLCGATRRGGFVWQAPRPAAASARPPCMPPRPGLICLGSTRMAPLPLHPCPRLG